MGIYCEINLFKTPNGAYVPGGTVSGIIKYAIDEPTVFNEIIVSLKGSGFLSIKEQRRRKNTNTNVIHRNSETYVDIDCALNHFKKGTPLPIGSYEQQITFQLPHDIPGSLQYHRRTVRYVVRCRIAYYVRIKFVRPGIFNFNKHFKRDVTVLSGLVSDLPTIPTTYGIDKSVFHMCLCKKSLLSVKATIENSVLTPGDKIQVDYEVNNNTRVNVQSIETRLMEMYAFKTKSGRIIRLQNYIENCDSKTGSVQCGDSKTMNVEFDVPSNIGTLQNSKLVSRDYQVNINVNLPMPHWDAALNIPLQIGEVRDSTTSLMEDPPPSYWEVMNEEKEKGDDEISEDEND